MIGSTRRYSSFICPTNDRLHKVLHDFFWKAGDSLGVFFVGGEVGGRNQTTETGLEPQHRKEHHILSPLSMESNSTKNQPGGLWWLESCVFPAKGRLKTLSTQKGLAVCMISWCSFFSLSRTFCVQKHPGLSCGYQVSNSPKQKSFFKKKKVCV